jgi:hypothetical protein
MKNEIFKKKGGKVKIKLFVIAGIGMTLFLYKCSPFQGGWNHAPAIFNVQGIVTDYKDGTPIKDVFVGISNLASKCSTSTDNDGNYFFNGCVVDVYEGWATGITASKPGYVSVFQSANLEKTSNLQIIKFVLNRQPSK